MRRSIVLLPLILFITLSASAQDSSEQTGKFRIRAIELHPFINLQRIPKASLSEFHDLASGSREISRTSPSFTASGFIPLGGDLTLGQEGFWERSHLFYEARAGWRFTRLSNGIQAQAPGIQHGLGFRFDV
jgi:hypothetical protein